MHTSYFAKYKEDNGVSIAIGTPKWFTGKSYRPLFPTWDILNAYKQGKINEEQYVQMYLRDVLSKLDAKKVYNDLCNSVLLCYERSDAFCHRHIVARWLEHELGITITEI